MVKINKEILIEFSKKIKERILAFLKSEGFKMVAIVFSCLFAFVIVFPSYLDNSKLKFDISQRLSKLTQATISIRGNLDISLLPVPTISLKEVFIENYAPMGSRSEVDNFYNIYCKNVKVVYPILKLNNRQLIKNLIADGCIIEGAIPDILSKIENSLFAKKIASIKANQNDSKNVMEEGLSSKIFSIDDLESTAIFLATPPSIQLNDSIITFFNETGVNKEFTEIYSTIEFDKDFINGYGSFVSQSIDNEFKINTKFNSQEKEPDSFFSLNSSVFNLKIQGNFLENNLKGLLRTKFNGFVELEINDLKNFYKSLISSNDAVSNKLKSINKTIKISSFINNENKNLDLKKIIINSDVINGNGDIAMQVNDDNILVSDVKLNIDDFNIDSIWSTENPARKLVELNSIPKAPENSNNKNEDANKNLPTIGNSEQKISLKSPPKIKKRLISDLILLARDYDINLEIFIQKANLYQEVIQDIKIFANIPNLGKMVINPLSFKIANDSEFRINGILEDSSNNTKLIGYIDGKGQSLNEVFKWLKIKSDIIKTDNLKNFTLYSDFEVDQNAIFLNNFYINLEDKKTEFYGDFSIKDFEKKRSVYCNIKASEFDVQKYLILSKNNPYFREGILFDKLLWLNEVFSDFDLKIKFDKFIYRGNEFVDQELAIQAGRGFLKFPKTRFKSIDNIFDLEFNVDISDKNQIANFLLNADKLTMKFRDEHIDSIKNYRRSIFDKYFELPSLQGFSGDIDFSVKQLVIDDKIINDFEHKNSFKNSVFGQSKTSMKLYDGTFEFKGLNDIKYNKIINGNFSCKGCDIGKILSELYHVNSISGIANISGNLVSIGKSYREFIDNLNSEISLAISSPKIKGYGLTDLVKKIYAIQANAKELSEPEKIIENKDSSTQYLQGKGFINIKGEKNSNFSISLKAPLINSIFSGMVFMKEKSLNGTLNTIFVAVNAKKQVPINIATNVVGFFDDTAQVSNLNQARQFLGLDRIKNEELNKLLLAKTEEKKNIRVGKILEKAKNLSKNKIPETKKLSPENENNSASEDNLIEKTKIIEENISTNQQNNDNLLSLDNKNSLKTQQPIVESAMPQQPVSITSKDPANQKPELIASNPKDIKSDQINKNLETIKNFQKSQEIIIPDFDTIKNNDNLNSENVNIIQPSI